MQEIFEFIRQLDLSILQISLIVMFLGFIHPIISQPAYTLSVTMTIFYLGLFKGICVLLFSSILGIAAYYFLVRFLAHKLNLVKHPKINKALAWISKTPGYKHSISLGLPLVPTYFIKLALPISKKSFKQYMLIMIGSYIVLLGFNISFYYGILVIFFTGRFTYITFIVLVIFIIFLYTINDVRSKFFKAHQ